MSALGLVDAYAKGHLSARGALATLWERQWAWEPPRAAVEALGVACAVEDWKAALEVHALHALSALDDALAAAGTVGCHRDAQGRVCVVCDRVEQARAVAIATCARDLVRDVPHRAGTGLVTT